MFDLDVKYQINKNDVASLISSALEGGSNYWCIIRKSKSVEPLPIDLFKWDLVGDFWHILWPLSRGGRLYIESVEDMYHNGYLDLDSCKRGLMLMAQKHPRHWSDFVSGNWDAETGDVFLQLALFGELIYG
jgi:hypothetical protein